MNHQVEKVNHATAYRDRFLRYAQIYHETCPEPPKPQPQQQQPFGNPDLGAQKTALNRKVRYNDKQTTQTINPSGGSNAKS